MPTSILRSAPEQHGGKCRAPVPVREAHEVAGVLGDYFYVGRAAKIQQRVPLVRTTEIIGVVEKPRRFYVLTEQLAQWMGTPVFNAQGRVLGITLQHFANGQRSGLIVLPAEDIAEMAKQATAAQAATAKSGG
jgi:hypothetical protein